MTPTGLVSGPLPADDVGINVDRSTVMHAVIYLAP
jgi:hypothetical protein